MTDNRTRPYGSSVAAYDDGSAPERRAVLAARGRRAVEFGAAWLIGGLLAAVVTHDQAEGALGYVVSWGPMLYGVLRVATGVRLLVRSRESP